MKKKLLRYYIHTFGCQMNDNDSEKISGILLQIGAQKAGAIEKADLVIINTCAVRAKSEEKLYSLLGRLGALKRSRPNDFFIGVVGCVAQIARKELTDKLPYIDFVMGPDNYLELPEIIGQLRDKNLRATSRSRNWREIPDSRIDRSSSITGYVTIMEGCNNFCSYCVVPFTRGREKFRPRKNIIREIESLARKDYLEIQLLGQNVNSYRDPDSEDDFCSLLRSACQISGIKWIRFITSHPKNFSIDIARTMAREEKICKQLHLPVQTGSTSVLERMKRGYSRQEYLDIINSLKDLMPDISLSTDIIVGFPGETDQEFEDTLSLLKEVRYTNIFSFRYSPRPHTEAAGRDDSVPFETKRQRLIQVQNLQKEIQLEMNRTKVGGIENILCMGRSKKDFHVFSGRNEDFQVVNFPSSRDITGRFIDVKITGFGPYSLNGRIIKKSISNMV